MYIPTNDAIRRQEEREADERDKLDKEIGEILKRQDVIEMRRIRRVIKALTWQ